MTEFILNIDQRKFRSTNVLWNNLMLNDPLSVGYVSSLISLQQFPNKEDWEQFYYNSGQSRLNQLSKLDPQIQGILQDETLIISNKEKVQNASRAHGDLNTQYGRTPEDLKRKGDILFNNLGTNIKRLTAGDCFECVRFRVICETWNGIIIREKNTIELLKKKFAGIEFRGVSAEVDYNYAVDYEAYKNNTLICGIQIKPPSYLWNASYIINARKANEKKNASYTEQFKASVITVISDKNGNIQNPEVLNVL